MKIVFIGAGMASLVASERLARAGFDVSVYEKQTYDTLSYDWHDDVNRAASERRYVFYETQLDVRSAG